MLGTPAVKYLPGLGLGVAALLALGLGCSGPAFEPGGAACEDDACGAGSTSGGSQSGSTGGKSSGGRAGSAAGGQAGATNGGSGSEPMAGAAPVAGGGATAGSAGEPGVSGSGGSGSEPPPFPATDVLDDFNRAGPGLGLSWLGGTDNYSLVEEALWCQQCGAAVFWEESFDAEQEVHATFSGFRDSAAEINLVLKAQNDPNCELIEVLYSPQSQTARIAYCTEQAWTDLAEKPLTLEAGDRFGGRALASGEIEVYVNEQLFATFDASGFPHETGRVGVNGVSSVSSDDGGLSWDDFGGGNWR